MDIPAHCFLIVHPGKPEHGTVICDDSAWPGFSATGWVRKDAAHDGAPAPAADVPPAPVAAPAAEAPRARKPRATPAPVKDAHGAFG